MQTEKEIRWGLVVESDQIHSAKTGKWYEVERVRLVRGKVEVKVAGVPKPMTPQDPKHMVLVRRGPTGDAVDLIEIIFSGERKL